MNRHDLEQKRIESAALANRVLRLLAQHQRVSDAGSIEDGIRWTAETIAAQLVCDDVEAVRRALTWLESEGYIQRRTNEWIRTDLGVDYYQSLCKKSSINTSPLAFKTEALTGMDHRGNETTLTRAAIPAPDKHYANEDSTIQACDESRQFRAMAAQLGVSTEEFHTGWQEGRYGWCKGTDATPAHVGVFGPHRGKGGRQRQYLCKSCIAELAREYRRKKKCR